MFKKEIFFLTKFQKTLAFLKNLWYNNFCCEDSSFQLQIQYFYGEVLKWPKRRDSKSRRALTRRVGSNPTFSANKKRTFVYQKFLFVYPSRRLGISSRRSRVYHQPLWGCISSRASVHLPAA